MELKRSFRSKRANRWKGALLGVAGGAAGTLVMAGYWKALKAFTGRNLRKAKSESPGPLADIALVESPMRKGESSTETEGRVAYDKLTGSPRILERRASSSPGSSTGPTGSSRERSTAPCEAAQSRPISRVPASSGPRSGESARSGLPIVGLGKGPTAYAPEHHAASLGAHLVYGLTTASVVQLLRRWF